MISKPIYFWLPFIPTLVSVITILTITASCSRQDPQQARLREGEKLAKTYCVLCHQFPKPKLLPKKIWEEILPKMGARMGLSSSAAEMEHMVMLKANGLFPSQSMVTLEDWFKIQDFYLSLSPDSLKTPKTEIESEPLALFNEKAIQFPHIEKPSGSLVKFGEKPFELWYGDALKNQLFKYNLKNSSFEEFQLDGAPSHLNIISDGFQVLTMGNIHPNDWKRGKIFQHTKSELTAILSQLPRPVHASYGDLNDDGREDIVVSGFGYMQGSLAWYENTEQGYNLHMLRALPGALKTDVVDLDKDGFMDILALMAQGDEGFFFYKGDGKGNFKESKVYAFPPSHGSSYYELVDMNKDGLEDIVYVNGDNGDYSVPILKPYHGVSILLNNGDKETPTFEEEYFYSMNGPFKAMPEDYDLDGDIDIACISYFPDYENTPEESFIYLERTDEDNFEFKAQTIEGATKGRWLIADRNDYDGDGDIDIALGNSLVMSYFMPDQTKYNLKISPFSILLLENNTK
ncbi:VCBS repeat-containing protein [Flammeovirgaceae bacterium SG7u.111]|nr:VCBS repeat-containing protein [Flammeovirgaceae bacterium SG7u.132]WPO36339.1 VCBS repeat-containing protein [Flammeovirgaceae bacterium SG7u.111]